MAFGPNMKRLRELPPGDGLEACVLAGPGDLEVWEVHTTVTTDGVPLEIVGRGTDMESAAAAVLAMLQQHPWDAPEHPEAAEDAKLERRAGLVG